MSPETPQAGKWVFWSTSESIRDEVKSYTAVAETICAVPLYWFITIYFESYLPLLTSLAVAPMVLPRSDESVALGVRWFRAWKTHVSDNERPVNKRSTRARIALWLLMAAVLSVSFGLAYLLSVHLLAGANGWAAFWSAALIALTCISSAIAVAGAGAVAVAVAGAVGVALAVALAVAGAVALAVAVAGAGAVAVVGAVVGAVLGAGAGAVVPIVLGYAVGVLMVSLTIRVSATMCYLAAGIKQLPRNFRRLTICTSPLQTPELVPGLQSELDSFTLPDLIAEFHDARRSGDRVERIFVCFVLLSAAFLWFFPAWVYRLTLKSTAWFWWPLAFLGGETPRALHPGLIHDKTIGSLAGKSSIAASFTTLILFVATNSPVGTALLGQYPFLTVWLYPFTITWSGVAPWQLLPLTVAGLTIILLFWVDSAIRDHRYAEGRQAFEILATAQRQFRWIERVARLRLVLLTIFMLVAFGHAMLYFNQWGCWFSLPANVQAWAQWIYGNKMPLPPCALKS